MNVRQAQACDLQQLPVSMAMRSHLFSYRTQKLSSSAQMVLGWTGHGPGEYVDAGFQNKSTQHQLGAFVLEFDAEHTLPCPAKVLSARLTIYFTSRTTVCYPRPTPVREREGVTPSHRGVKMSERRDSSRGTRSVASDFAFSRREKEHVARRASALGIVCREAKKSAMCDADTCPGEYVDAGFQNKKLTQQCELFVLQLLRENYKKTQRGNE